MVKTEKARTFLFGNQKCDTYNTFLSADKISSQVEAVELNLKIESSEQINETLTKEELQTAGEMFLYLNTCPIQDNDTWTLNWKVFYDYLFLTQPADQIILTLNRMMKGETPQDKDVRVRAEKLMKRISSLMSLSFENIQSLLPEKNSRKRSVNTDFLIHNGKHFLSFYKCLFSKVYIRFRYIHSQPSSYIDLRQEKISISLHTIL